MKSMGAWVSYMAVSAATYLAWYFLTSSGAGRAPGLAGLGTGMGLGEEAEGE